MPNAFMEMLEQVVTLSRDVWVAMPR